MGSLVSRASVLAELVAVCLLGYRGGFLSRQEMKLKLDFVKIDSAPDETKIRGRRVFDGDRGNMWFRVQIALQTATGPRYDSEPSQ